MNKVNKLETIRRAYFHKLLSDKSVENKMLFFTRAEEIFDLGRKKAKVQKEKK